MVRLLHLADLHLDSPFRGLGRSQPELAAALLDASLVALDRAVDTAIELREQGGLDAVTMAGDLFDAGSPSLRARARLTRALRRLDEAGIRCLIVTGNHDPHGGRDTWARVALPPGTRLFDAGWGSEELHQNGHHVATVVGRSYAANDLDREALADLPRPEAPLRIGLLHTDVDGSSDERAYAPVRLQALLETRFDAWLLGHIHAGRQLCADPLVVYPGTIQGRDMGLGETGPKGAVLVELEPGRPPACSAVPLGPIQWERVDVDIAGCVSEQDVIDTAHDTLTRRVAPHADGLIARVRLIGAAGSVSLWQRLSSGSGPAELAEALAALDRRPFILIEDLRSEATGPLPDGAELRARADLLGDFLRVLDDARAPGSPAAGRLDEALAAFGQRGPAKEFREATGWDPDRAEIVAEAERLVLGRLLPYLEVTATDEA